MPTHRSHDRDRIQPDRHDELTEGVPAPVSEQADAGQESRTPAGRFAPGATALQKLGGKARRGRTKLTHDVPDALPVSDRLKNKARFARRRMATELARTVGGGACGMMASAFIKLGVEDMALREAALEEGNVDLARKLGESARSHLLYGRETCAKDAASRPRRALVDEIDAQLAKQSEGDHVKPE